MSNERLVVASQRIEKAMRRIDTAVTTRMTDANGAAAAGYSHLATRHDALRDEVRAALGAIDAVIASRNGT